MNTPQKELGLLEIYINVFDKIKASGKEEFQFETILHMNEKGVPSNLISNYLDEPLEYIEKVISGEIEFQEPDFFKRT